MRRSIRYLFVILALLQTTASSCMAWDGDWTVLTVARDGSWGVASSDLQSRAMAEAIRFCKAMAMSSSDCGAQLKATRGGWAIANLCGDQAIIATGSTLREAEKEALNSEIGLQMFYIPDLQPCRRVVTANPDSFSVVSTLPKSFAQNAARRP
jgi:hypothetical protein